MKTFVDFIFTYFPKSSGLFDERSAQLLRFKRGHAFEMAFFRSQLGMWLQHNITQPTMLCCIPSSNPNKFNSISKIAAELSRQNDLLLDGSGCIVKRYATPSVCTGQERKLELFEKSFSISRKVIHQHVILLDDVTSTGLSMAVLERLLLDAGATSVYCLALFETHKLHPR
jgi:predicted amidophosphoribosyltransferase